MATPTRVLPESPSPVGDSTQETSALDGVGAETPQPSVLDIGRERPSYVFKESPVEPPIAGGGLLISQAMELDRQRAAETQMRRTQEQLMGAATQEMAREAEALERTPSPAAETRPRTERAETTLDMRAQALALAAQQAQETERVRQEEAQEQAQQTRTTVVRNQIEQIRGYVEKTELSNVIPSGGVSLLTWGGRLNLRVLNQLIFKNKFLGTLSLSDATEPAKFQDIVKAGLFDTAMALTWFLQPPMVFVTALIILIAIIASAY